MPGKSARPEEDMAIRNTLTLLFLFVASASSQAQETSGNPLLADDWLIRVGAAAVKADVKAGLSNEQLGSIPVIDLDQLGVDPDFTSFWTHIIWQAPKRWSWGLNYFRSVAEGEHLTDMDIEYGDLTIPAGTGVTSDFTTNFYVLNGYWDFYQGSNSAAGVGFGVYALDLDLRLQAEIGNQPGVTSEQANTLAPLPTVSLYYKHAFNDKWALWADVGYFSADIDEYDGDLLGTRINVEYWFNDKWGMGLGYNRLDIDITVDKSVFDQLWDVGWDAYTLYFTGGF
jgi:hypothetical protein